MDRPSEPDDNTLDNAGSGGREYADALTTKLTEGIDGFPAGGTSASPAAQRAAIARIVANNLYDYAEECER